MSGSLLDVAFAHTAWATLKVIDACLGLSVEQLRTNVIGTRGPIIETLRQINAIQPRARALSRAGTPPPP